MARFDFDRRRSATYFLLPVAIVCDAVYEFRRASRGLEVSR